MTQIFQTNVPGKTQCGKTGAASSRGFYYYPKSEYNNIRAPKWFALQKNYILVVPLSLGDRKYGWFTPSNEIYRTRALSGQLETPTLSLIPLHQPFWHKSASAMPWKGLRPSWCCATFSGLCRFSCLPAAKNLQSFRWWFSLICNALISCENF